jgi:hypothetical protein
MKKFTMPLAAVALVGLYAGSASAQCAFDIAPAKGVRGSMVRNYAPCPSTERPGPNTSTQTATPACEPVLPAAVNGQTTLYSYGPKGKCQVQTSAKLVSDCADLEDAAGTGLGLPPGPCHVTFVKSKCQGVLSTDGVLPIGAGDDGFTLATLTRATLNDPAKEDMTVIDFPVTFDYSTPDKGKMEVKSSSAEALKGIVGPNGAKLPPCTQLEYVNVIIKDPLGRPFAKLGSATVPK